MLAVSKWYAIVPSARESVRAAGTAYSTAARLELHAQSYGVELIRFDVDGRFAGDSWHETIEDAKRQAKFEFDVEASDWLPLH